MSTVVRGAEQARAASKKKAILEAATDLMISGGLNKVTHRQVAAEAGVPVGSIGYYYTSRENLIRVCLDSIQVRCAELIRQRAADVGPDTTVEQLAEIIVEAACLGYLNDLKGYILATVDVAREQIGSDSPDNQLTQFVALVDVLLRKADRESANARRIIEAVTAASILSSSFGDSASHAAQEAVIDVIS
ncbi:TetR/AcrR family transcriptional regulator [Corynebacterium mayonis]|uniref:TetR/AcrR family transcriptional regulator n=1 Tax=Corynebacterium mayonis TaxID=3062461 RepID=UPI0031409F3B